jgi:hypothetical protein
MASTLIASLFLLFAATTLAANIDASLFFNENAIRNLDFSIGGLVREKRALAIQPANTKSTLKKGEKYWVVVETRIGSNETVSFIGAHERDSKDALDVVHEPSLSRKTEDGR